MTSAIDQLLDAIDRSRSQGLLGVYTTTKEFLELLRAARAEIERIKAAEERAGRIEDKLKKYFAANTAGQIHVAFEELRAELEGKK